MLVQRLVGSQSGPDALPNIELSLVALALDVPLCFWTCFVFLCEAPPLHPWPQVVAELGRLDENRERMENANMHKLQEEFNKAWELYRAPDPPTVHTYQWLVHVALFQCWCACGPRQLLSLARELGTWLAGRCVFLTTL